MVSRALPPLKSLVHFEAAARLQSFTAASAELNVTQGAVSRQIRQLEDALGRQLFHRDRRQVVLTDDGHNYYVSIVDVLDQLASASESLSSASDPGQVTLVTSSALASMYLLPRIPEFRRVHPAIQIRIVARDDMSDGVRTEHDLSLYYMREPDKNSSGILFTEEVFPVCSPDYLKQNKKQFKGKSFSLSNLIWLESPENWINWPEWLARVSIEGKEFPNRFVVNSYPMVVQAAIAGQGVALAWSGLVDSMLEQNLLVRPTNLQLLTEAAFVVKMNADSNVNENASTFCQWLTENQ